MKKQNTKNLFKLKYGVKEMLSMAACGNIGGILMSSIGESKQDKLKKWKEGAFQMSLTATPMLLVDGIIKLCEKSKNPNKEEDVLKNKNAWRVKYAAEVSFATDFRIFFKTVFDVINKAFGFIFKKEHRG